MELKTTAVETPCGTLTIYCSDGALMLCDWQNSKHLADHIKQIGALDTVPDEAMTEKAVGLLRRYFDGELRELNIPLRPAGTEFRQQVWEALLDIPYGTTATYTDVAVAVGKPSGARAVATAIADNPISIFIPCHRVVGSNGKITGYAGGAEAKRHLIELEKTRLR
ncbi:MAG: methylated-DNA--[protein]-cysteine S-methyltransferase [Clostridium sp.]|nr:methylated-DNA--[protein]-cysteine S-methyltransferase [Clostridium sp.]